MSNHPSKEEIAQARAAVLAWVRLAQPGEYATNEDLAVGFCSLLPAEVGLGLRWTHNPSALVYEARWFQCGREIEEFPKPFAADDAGDACVLACAAMIALPE